MYYVTVPPMIWIQNQLVGAYEGQQISLDCHSEAYPKSINYWTKDNGIIISQGIKQKAIFLNHRTVLKFYIFMYLKEQS